MSSIIFPTSTSLLEYQISAVYEPHRILLHLQTFQVTDLDYIDLASCHPVDFESRICCQNKSNEGEKERA